MAQKCLLLFQRVALRFPAPVEAGSQRPVTQFPEIHPTSGLWEQQYTHGIYTYTQWIYTLLKRRLHFRPFHFSLSGEELVNR